MADKFEKIISFRPAYDKRDPDPSKNYGIHGVDMRFIFRGDLGAIQFVLYTGWHLPHVQKDLLSRCRATPNYCPINPLPADIGYHSPKPMFDGQGTMTDNCEWLDGKPCYYDGSGLNAEEYFQILVEKGDDGLWEAMEKYYNDTFKEKTGD